MDDVQVYERIDSVLKEKLSEQSFKDIYQTLTNNLTPQDSLSYSKQFIKKYFETIGYTFLSSDQEIKFLFKGQEISFDIITEYNIYQRNITIEFECNGEPSGINSTKADYVLILFPLTNYLWRIKTSHLRQFINNHKDNNMIIQTKSIESAKYFLLNTNFDLTQKAFTCKNLSDVLDYKS